MKQTAVEWLVETMQKQIDAGYGFSPKHEEEIIQQAKEMEKEQKEYSKKDVIAAMSWAIAHYKTNYVEDYFKLLQRNL